MLDRDFALMHNQQASGGRSAHYGPTALGSTPEGGGPQDRGRRRTDLPGSSRGDERNDGSISDSAVSFSLTEARKKRRPSLGDKVASLVGFNRKSSSATHIPDDGELVVILLDIIYIYPFIKAIWQNAESYNNKVNEKPNSHQTVTNKCSYTTFCT